MCDCIKQIEEELIKKGYSDADVQGTAFIMGNSKMVFRTVQDCTYKDGVTKSGKDRIKHVPIKHDYCPFCGKKYE